MRAKRLICAVYILSSVFLSGCWSSHEVNELAISVCIGIDKSDKGYIISEQVVNPRAIVSQRATNESPVILYTGEGKNIENTIVNMAMQSSRKIYSSHLRMVVLSEAVAKDGIYELICYLMRSHEYRTDFYFIIAQGCTAKDLLSVLTPEESIPGIEMYNKMAHAAEDSATVREMRIIELANNLAAEGINPVITGAEIVGENGLPLSTDDLRKTPGLAKIRYTGLGAFADDRLAGWLGEDESKGYNLITGHVKHLNVYSGIGDSLKITYDIDNVKSKIKAKVENGNPKVNVDIRFDYSLADLQGEFDLTRPENRILLDGIAADKVKSFCEAAVYKTQEELKTDIFGFGERIHGTHPRYWMKVKGAWNSVYPDISVSIKVTARIKETGEGLKAMSAKEK